MKTKKGKINPKMVEASFIGILVIVVLVSIMSVIIPEAQTAGSQMNDSIRCQALGCYYNGTTDECDFNATVYTACPGGDNTIPLSSLFTAGGVVFVLIMVGLFITLVKPLIGGTKK